MPNRINDLEQKVDRLLRYIGLLEKSIQDLKEQVETRKDIDTVEKVLYAVSKPFKCRKPK